MKNIIYHRQIESRLRSLLFKGKIVILYGPRQVGKTTLVKKLCAEYKGLYLLCEEPDINQAFTHKTSTEMKAFIGDKKFIVLDEAQKVEDIGTSLKLLIDNFPDMQIIATGSSSFDLANKINEPLTGRNYELKMYPLSISEIIDSTSLIETKRLLERNIIYGTYPGVINAGDLIEENLKKIANDYLYKDLLKYEGIRKPDMLEKILKALAYQVGSLVSYSEIAMGIGVNKETVRSYVEMLEKAFIIFKLKPLHKNKRDEIKSLHKIYFYDNGILNTLLQDYHTLDSRKDSGFIFENFFISEKVKYINNNNLSINTYFWRKQKNGEVDLIEELTENKTYKAYECKLSERKSKVPALFQAVYKPESYQVINKSNIVDVLKSDNKEINKVF